MIRSCITAVFIALPGLAGAQPYSESMADCAAFYQNAAQWIRSDEKAETLLEATRAWHAAALNQAQREGRPLNEDALWDRIDGKTTDLEARGSMFLMSEEFRDWAGYCRKFGKSQGIPALNNG